MPPRLFEASDTSANPLFLFPETNHPQSVSLLTHLTIQLEASASLQSLFLYHFYDITIFCG
jgi:hypothetical protein